MLSQTSEYALRAVSYLVGRTGEGFIGVKEIAQNTNIPTNYLAKILQRLARTNILASQKGAGGGFRIEPPLSWITVLDVVQAMEDTSRMHQCLLGVNLCHGRENCPLHAKQTEYLESLRTTTLQNLLEYARRQKAEPVAPVV